MISKRAASIFPSVAPRDGDTAVTRETKAGRPDFGLAHNVLILVNLVVRPERFELPTY